MIPLESPVPEIGPPGSEGGGHWNRPAARLRKHRMSHRPYRLRASPRLYTNLVGTLFKENQCGAPRSWNAGPPGAGTPGGAMLPRESLARPLVRRPVHPARRSPNPPNNYPQRQKTRRRTSITLRTPDARHPGGIPGLRQVAYPST